MKKSVLMVLATACLLVSAAHCAHTQGPPLTQKKVFSGSETPFAMKVGDEFVLTLESNPSTGYLWRLAVKPDENTVKLVSSEYRAAPDTNRVGAGGNEVWTFLATGKGKAEIGLIYVRPWEKDKPPARTARVIIIVE
ncbi:MAG TPA: protease inhibitor I42 family protein [Syntrophorhabdaceae bacterium]|nr:protease inhibitor I42 family protein [Syntrophorhabdaceae bacterium]